MSTNQSVRKLCVQVLIATVATFAAASAQACHSYDIVCKAKKAATKAADDAANLAKSTADKAAADARAAADQAAAAAKVAADQAAAAAKAAADQLAKQGAAISKSEMTSMLAQARNLYADTDAAMKNGLNQIQKLINAALEAVWRAAGKSAVKQSATLLTDMRHRAMNLNAEGQAALNRVRRAVAAKNIDEQARTDMQLLMSAIVYGGSQVPSNVKKSSFGIQICDSVGAGYAGGESCYMMIMQTFLEDGKFKVGLARSLGLAASPAPSDLGAESSFGIFWGPGGIRDNGGTSIGLGLGAFLEEGAEVGVSWGVPTMIPDPSSLVPGMSISVGGGAKGEVAMTGGYTQIITVL